MNRQSPEGSTYVPGDQGPGGLDDDVVQKGLTIPGDAADGPGGYGGRRSSYDARAATAVPAEDDRAHGRATVHTVKGRAPGGALTSDPESLRRRWESVQVGFVDDPRRAVGEAEELVSTVMDDLVSGFRDERRALETQWSGGGEPSTDELRQAFQRYRDFFDRLLLI